MGGPPLVCNSIVAPCFYGGPGFFHEHSWLWSSLLLSLQAVSLQPTAVPSLCLLSKPHVPEPSLHPQYQTHISGWGVQGCGMDPQWRSYTVLPATDRLLQCPLSPQIFHSVPADLPASEGAFLSVGTSPLLQVPPKRCRSHPVFSFLLFFFPFFILPGCLGIFLVLLGVQGPLLVFSRCSVRIVPFVDVVLMYLWGEVNSTSSYSAILTPHQEVLKVLEFD